MALIAAGTLASIRSVECLAWLWLPEWIPVLIQDHKILMHA